MQFIIYWLLNPSIAFWTMVTCGLTLLLFVVAYRQLRSISKTSKADFIHRFNKDFYTEETRKITRFIDENKLKFNPKSGDFADGISSYDVDDLVLGHFEDLGAFEKRGYLDIKMVYDFFDYYIEACWDNPEIQKYLAKLSGGSDIYENFKYIYLKCKSFGVSKNNKREKILWKIRWKLIKLLAGE